MRQELDEELCRKYPKIFANRNGDPKDTMMCWGFECGNGWYNLLDQLCHVIQSHIDWNNRRAEKYPDLMYKPIEQVVAVQVKEKFGALRFYYDGGNDIIAGMISMAEAMSAVTCETCGSPGKQQSGSWIKTLCEEHANKRTKND